MSVYSVSVYPGSVTIRKGEWYYGAYATVRASSNYCQRCNRLYIRKVCGYGENLRTV